MRNRRMMTNQSTIAKIVVMKAYAYGRKIQVAERGCDNWIDYDSRYEPKWNWERYRYRIKPKRDIRYSTTVKIDEDSSMVHCTEVAMWPNTKEVKIRDSVLNTILNILIFAPPVMAVAIVTFKLFGMVLCE